MQEGGSRLGRGQKKELGGGVIQKGGISPGRASLHYAIKRGQRPSVEVTDGPFLRVRAERLERPESF